MGVEMKPVANVFEGERKVEGGINPSKLLEEGWHYRDLPWMTRKALDLLLSIAGPGNYVGLAMSSRGDAVRGQVLFSPEAMENFRARANTESAS
jgi:hypothetical protein